MADLERWWRARRERWLRVSAIIMLALAVPWLGYQFWRLTLGEQPIWPTSPPGAVDLRIFRRLVSDWSSGEPVYADVELATYPPASYLMLWPLVSWLPLEALRWLWAGLYCLTLWRLSRWVAREAGAEGVARRLLLLLPLAIYAPGATIGNGQLGLFVLGALVILVDRLQKPPYDPGDIVLISAMLVLAMIKPSLALPFGLLVLVVPGGWRAALLAGAAYLGLTALSSIWQADSIWGLLRSWLAVASWRGATYLPLDLHGLAGALGWQDHLWGLTLVVLLAAGLFLHRHRRAPVLWLAAICAVVARFWAHHAWYDDLLMLLPMVALWQLASLGKTPRQRVAAGLLFALTLVSLLAPGGMYVFPGLLRDLYLVAQVVIWLADLACVMTAVIQSERRRAMAPAT